MDPEETSMAILRHPFTSSLTGILPEKFANHGLRDGLDHAGIRDIWIKTSGREWIGPSLKCAVEL
jgi:hypothetical protein